jgi:uroporphyrin-III C-methyltransferase
MTGAGSSTTSGQVILVGGGPGDPDLLTVGGLRALREADVVLYDHLAPLACLEEARPGAVLIDVGKIPRGCQTAQTEINDLLIEHARSGATVVRFKGGDPFVLGRGSEEWLACADAGIPVRVIPGVSSAIAGPELAGIPLTHRGLSQSFSVVSGHVGPEHPASTVNWTALARSTGTIVILMGVAHLPEICAGLISRGLAAGTPAAIVAKAATPDQHVVRGTVASLPGLSALAHVEPPALIVIGEVVGLDLGLPEPATREEPAGGDGPGGRFRR